MLNNFSGMILAAGYGKRMLPLTKDKPKPLIKVNGKTLLDNSINFLQNIGCKQIIINSHYKYLQIKKSINTRKDKKNITLLHENKILDTAGAVKNAIKFFKNDNIIIINSDVFWRNENIKDVKKLIKEYKKNLKSHLLLVNEKNTFGLKKKKGDFFLKQKNIYRYDNINAKNLLYFTGLQILNIDIFNNFNKEKFSFNEVWDYLIKKNILFGKVMTSNWYHVGDIQGLNIAKELDT